MRLKITLEKDNLSLPLAYKHIIQAVIYNMFERDTLGKFYHDKGFEDKEKKYKLFVFSDLFGKYQINNKRIIFEKRISFYISSLDEVFIKTIYEYLINNNSLFILNQQVSIVGVTIQDLKPFIKEKEIIIETLSPVVAYSSKDKFVTYYKPSNKLFNTLVLDNLKHKITAYNYPVNELSFDIKEVLYEKRIMSKFKNTFYESYKTRIKVVTNYETLNLIYNTGLSSKGSCGFGMIEIKDEKDLLSL